jgi:hypothetical protein
MWSMKSPRLINRTTEVERSAQKYRAYENRFALFIFVDPAKA